MQTRRLGKSDLSLSAVGFGAWAIGGAGWDYSWGPQDDSESVRAIHRALDLGVNWIDTAAVYGLGHSEEVVSRALTDRPNKVIVATKCGLRWRENRSVYPHLKAESVRKEAEDSLRRLKLEVIDLYQIHWPSPPAGIEEAWGVVADLIREGKVRCGGVCNFSVAQLERLQSIHPVTSLQPPYSMVNRAAERELLPYCADKGIGVVAYSPMQCGLLTGAFSQERLAQLDEQDWRRKDQSFKEPTFSKTLELVERLRPISLRHQRTPAQLAVSWVLRQSEVTSAIVGARGPGQIEDTAQAGNWQLSADEVDEIENTLREVAVPSPASLR